MWKLQLKSPRNLESMTVCEVAKKESISNHNHIPTFVIVKLINRIHSRIESAYLCTPTYSGMLEGGGQGGQLPSRFLDFAACLLFVLFRSTQFSEYV